MRRYRPGRPLPAVPLPALAELPFSPTTASPGGLELDLRPRGVEATLSLPRRPQALALVVGDEPHGFTGLESCAVARVKRADLAAALGHLKALPETRSLPLIVVGAGADAPVALALTARLGPAADGLILDREVDSPVVLTPTRSGRGDCREFVGKCTGAGRPRLAHAQRRRLSRSIERELRREHRARGCRGSKGGMRATLAGLASAIVFMLSFGPDTESAEAAWTTTAYDTTTGQLNLTADGGDDALTLSCDANDDVEFNIGGGPQNLPQPFFPTLSSNLQCDQVLSISVVGGPGDDTLLLGGVTTAANEYTQVDFNGVTIDGGTFPDSITGPQGTDLDGTSINGSAGNDTIIGGSGADLIRGGTQDDSLSGGGDSDTLDIADATLDLDVNLGTGTSTGRGTDTLAGIENAIGGTGNDSIVAGSATTSLIGGTGGDTLRGATSGPSTLDGGDGADSLDSNSTHADRLLGGIGADTLTAGSGNDTLQGDADGDSLVGEAGTDSLDGLAGDDTLEAGDTDNDTLAGGADTDYASYAFAGAGVMINLATGSATGAGTDNLSAVEGAIGSDFQDTINGSSAANTLYGNAGSDSITAQAGADVVFGEDDNDTINGGTGANTLAGDADQDVILTSFADAAESITGGAGNDTLTAAAGGTTVSGDAGTDDITGSSSTTTGDSLLGGTEADTIDGDSSTSFGGPDTIVGQGDGDSITGGLGADLLDGNLGDDVLDPDGVNLQEANVDTLIGNSGTDTLSVVDGSSGAQYTLTSTALDDGTTEDSLDGFERASLVGGVGGNFFDAAAFSGPVTMDPGSGDDTMIGGPAADSLNNASFGDVDEIRFAGDTNQVLTSSQHSSNGINDTLAGIERASLAGGSSANQIDASGFTGPVTLDGAGGNDTLLGGVGFGGEDSLIGGAGGADRIVFAEDQPQVLQDTLHSAGTGGGQEDDTLSGIEQASLTGGASGNDLDATSFTGTATLDGSAGNDTLRGGSGNDSLLGGGDDDRVLLTANSNQTLTNTQLTGVGTDSLASIERASLTGGTSANQLDASAFSAGSVTLSGGDAADTLLGGSGNDSLRGDAGTDRIVQTVNADQDLSSGFVSGDGDDSLNSIERASLSGGSSANLIDASDFAAGVVTLAGLGGNDSLYGGTGDDSLDGGANTDRVEIIANADQTLTDTLLSVAGFGDDTLAAIEGASLRSITSPHDLDASGFSGPATLVGNALDTIEGGSGNDSLNGGFEGRLIQSGNVNHVFTGPTVITGRGTDTVSNFDDMSIEGGAGANNIDVSLASAVFTSSTLAGLGGSDTIRGGGFTDSIDGGAGTDSLPAGNGFADTLAGGSENDTLVGDTQDRVLGDAGDDSLDVSAGASSIDGGAGAADLLFNSLAGSQTLTDAELQEIPGGTAPAVGIERASLVGTSNPEQLDAGAFSGQVTLDGGDSTDTLTGAAGNDSLIGGPSNDRLIQSADANQSLSDTLATGDGTDTVSGFESASLSGGASANTIDASAVTGTNVTLAGGGGNDTLLGGGLFDVLNGEGGTDEMRVTADSDQTLTGTQHIGFGGYVDTLTSVEAASLTGGAAANEIDASAFGGPVSLSGLGGGDTLVGGSSGDLISGLSGTDELDGNAGNDQLLGGPDADTLDGGGNSDSLDGGTASDSLDGGAGSDTLTGAGDVNAVLSDTLLSAGGENDSLAAASFEAASLTGGASANSIDASGFSSGPVSLAGLGGDDSLTGSGQNDSISGDGDNDSLQGGAGSDALDGGSGTNLADFSDDPGGSGINADLGAGTASNASTDTLASIQQLLGTSFGDTLVGDGGSNDLDGAGGADQVLGAGGADTLRGSAGNDVLTGGAGIDLLLGGADADTHHSTDGTVDTNQCGPGADTANADDVDLNVDCETVNATDTTPPETTITSGPGDGSTITVDSASFGFSSNEPGSTFECSIDGGPFAPCTSPRTYDSLSNGAHTFQVRAVDAAANTDGTPATRTFTVDAPDPDTKAPNLVLSGKKKQKSTGKVIVKAKCTDEACDLDATGTIKIKTLKKNGKVKSNKKYKLKSKSKNGVAAGDKQELKLKLKSQTKKKLKKVIKKKKSKATIEVTATDAEGNESRVGKFKVTVKK